LSSENHKSFYIPRGFAHGFVALEDNSIMLYQCDGEYDKKTDTGIKFDDPVIAINWPVDLNEVTCSPRDMQLMSFEEYEKEPMEV
jgi:dTDP-4-dehydrorhamnose 3,5-epimerase